MRKQVEFNKEEIECLKLGLYYYTKDLKYMQRSWGDDVEDRIEYVENLNNFMQQVYEEME